MSHIHDHLSAERLQAFLDGDLPERDVARVEEHLAECVRCAEELASWSVLFEDISALPLLDPRGGFAERVLAGLSRPMAPAAAAFGAHLGEAILQEYLDGALGSRQAARIEAHLASCTTCSSEADAWSSVIARLEGLERLAPTPGFRDRVLEGFALPQPRPFWAPWAARVRAVLGSQTAHVDAGRLHELVDGVLPARQASRIRTHLDGCGACAAEAAVWADLSKRLASLEPLRPRVGFADRVMAAIRVPETATVTAPALTPAARLRRVAVASAMAGARRFVPQTRQAWAAVSGVAVTPAVTVGLVLYAVFSHPTLTPGALLSFVGWQLADLATVAWGAVSAAALQSAQLFGLYSIFEALSAAPMALAGGALAYSLLSALALRVLYRNVLANRPTERRYVSAS